VLSYYTQLLAAPWKAPPPATEHPVIPVSVRSTIKSCCTIANDRRLSGRCKGAAVAARLTKIAAARPG